MRWNPTFGPPSPLGWVRETLLCVVLLAISIAAVKYWSVRKFNPEGTPLLTMGELCGYEGRLFDHYAQECRVLDREHILWDADGEVVENLRTVFDGPAENPRRSWIEQARYFDALATRAFARAFYFGDRIP